MKTNYTIQVPVIGGGKEDRQMERTDEFKGEKLGTELTDAHVLLTERCDHYENDDADGIEIHRGFWVKKSLVKHIDWLVQFGNVRTIASITYARPLPANVENN